MRIAVICLFMLSIQGIQAQNPPIDTIINTIKKHFAPDKRVAVFDVKIKNATPKATVVLEGETNLPDAKALLLEQLEKAGYKAVDEIRMLPDSTVGLSHFAIVNLSACNIRTQPKHAAELATQSTLGTSLRVLKREKDWYLVQTPDNYLGWLDDGGMQRMDEYAFRQWQLADKVVYLPDFGFAYEEPRTDAPVISDLLAGNILLNLGREGDFVKVGFADERTGFVPSSSVMDYQQWLNSRRPTVENILHTAQTFMGRPYLWGGTSGKGVDCSGFTKTVFYLNGLLLPRDASQQVFTGMEIQTDSTLANLLPGDLLFFGRRATEGQPEKVTHVAIYMGDGKIIHASGIVKIESLRREDLHFAEERLYTFLHARRLLETPGKYKVYWLKDVEWYKPE